MKGFGRKALIVAALCAAVSWVALPSAAELADVYLKSGTKLRGDVTTTEDEVIVRNAAGELRLPRDEVDRIISIQSPESQPGTQPESAPAGGAEKKLPTRPATTRASTQPLPKEAEKPERPELPAALPLSDADIQRLKLLELKLDGPAEPVRVRFKRKGKQRDLPAEVLEQLKRRVDFHPAWEEVLTRGQPYEKLQLIVRQTGTKYADRIEVENDPEVFEAFRRRVLPLMERGCARAGCHAGRTARVFRFPMGSTSGSTYAYTTFVLLDQMRTKHGPLLDRANPADSVLLSYMLPQENNPRPHPPVGRGPSFKSVIGHRDDRAHAAVLGWLNRLMVPRPEYGLEYENPYAGLLGPPAEAEEKDKPDGKEKMEEPPAGTQPAGRGQEPESKPAAADGG